MSDFVAGFAARHHAAAQALAQAFAPVGGFAPADIRARATPPAGFTAPVGPKHFSPHDREQNPTEGWDPLDPSGAEASFVDPLKVAHAAGFAEGQAAAFAEMRVADMRDEALLATIAEGLGGRIDRDRVAEQLRRTVLMLVAKLVGEVGIAPDILAGRIAAASELLADSAESALLRVHPDDVALLEGRLPKAVFAAGDASVPRGSFVLESASTIVEDGPELWLEQLSAAIERVPMPPC